MRLAFAALLGLLAAAPAFAVCDVTYRAQPGDTLQSIAAAHYGDAGSWTLLFYANPGLGNDRASGVPAGARIAIPCPAADTAPDATPLKQDTAELQFLTGSNYPPFTDRNWPGAGLITELVNAIMDEAPSPVPYAVAWNDDWSQHLFPLLDTAQVDMGFPWLKPDCAAEPANERCVNFHFSDPLFEMPIQLFVRADAGIVFETDADIEGLRLCRPEGYDTHDLDANGRNWVRDGKVTLLRPATPDDCIAMLMRGEADGMPENLFLGADRIHALGLKGQIVALPRPVSVETLHVVISKKHGRGTTFLYRVNAGLAAIRASGRYDEIVGRHLAIFRERLAG